MYDLYLYGKPKNRSMRLQNTNANTCALRAWETETHFTVQRYSGVAITTLTSVSVYPIVTHIK